VTHETDIVLPDGRHLTAGTEVTIAGGGRFVFRYSDGRGNLTFYGPVGNTHAKWRSFRAEKVRTIHRTTKTRP